MKNCSTASAVPASPSREASRSLLTPALRQRLKGLIDLGQKGLIHDSPDVLGALYGCCALVLDGADAETAADLAGWYDAEAADDGGDCEDDCREGL